ncbi:MAG: c-type cytochrome [Alphaproteobacteria bacterium]|nr:c-type cytochrome [Alphaproteobacteria bacterium]
MRVRRLFGVLVFAVPLVAAQAAQADDAEALLRKNACTTCHKPDHKVIGPSYKDIAAKYKGDPDALAKLMKKIKEGGGGVWGAARMPPHPNISDDDLKAMSEWILAQ